MTGHTSKLGLTMPVDGGPDDLPKTLRRQREQQEREARERALRERDARERQLTDRAARFEPVPLGPQRAAEFGAPFADEPQAAVVTAFNVPFFRLMMFLIKCVLAGIPAMLLLTVLLWGMGQALKAYAPELRHFQVIIQPVGTK